MHVEMEMRVRRTPRCMEDEEPRAAIMYRGRGGLMSTSVLAAFGESLRERVLVRSLFKFSCRVVSMTEVKSLEGGAPATEMHELQQDEHLATCRV